MRIHSPEGPVGTPPRELADAPGVLSGRRVALLGNGKPNADVLLACLAAELDERTGVSVGGRVTKANAATAAADDLLRALSDEADFVVTASAD